MHTAPTPPAAQKNARAEARAEISTMEEGRATEKTPARRSQCAGRQDRRPISPRRSEGARPESDLASRHEHRAWRRPCIGRRPPRPGARGRSRAAGRAGEGIDRRITGSAVGGLGGLRGGRWAINLVQRESRIGFHNCLCQLRTRRAPTRGALPQIQRIRLHLLRQVTPLGRG